MNTPPPTDPPGQPPLDPSPMQSAPPPPPNLPPPGLTPAAYATGYGPRAPRSGCLPWAMAATAAALVALALVLFSGLGTLVTQLENGGEKVLRAGDTSQRIVVLPVEGGIDDLMSTWYAGALRRIAENPPKALVIRVNSGGGGVTASDQMWNALGRFRSAHPDIPVVASFGSVAASGGYYIAAPSDYILCEPTGITGSIGVIAQVPALEDLAAMAGVEMNTVVADGSPQKEVANNLFENWRGAAGDLTEQGRESEAVLKRLTNSAWERFVEVVDRGRTGLTRDQVRTLADGSVYTASEAKTAGLVDEIGYLDEAIDKAAAMAGIDPGVKPHVTRAGRETSLLEALGATQTPPDVGTTRARLATADRLRTWVEDAMQVRLSYRMQLR